MAKKKNAPSRETDEPVDATTQSDNIVESNRAAATQAKIHNTSRYQLEISPEKNDPDYVAPAEWPNGEIKKPFDIAVDNGEVPLYTWPDGTPKLASTILEEQKGIALKNENSAAEKSADAQVSNTFSYEGKSYSMRLQKVNIPGMGIMTASDILSDPKAQEYLVKEGTVGSVISEVAE